ncbi:MAG: hypothetical protein NTW03_22160, partial [Verrucomicrobia bacterium]|nr:hypothetical protein [Verrucomicrobiota bacterium]
TNFSFVVTGCGLLVTVSILGSQTHAVNKQKAVAQERLRGTAPLLFLSAKLALSNRAAAC